MRKKSAIKSAAKAGLTAAIHKAAKAKISMALKRGPQPERLKINGNWEEAVAAAVQKPKPKGWWPKKLTPTTIRSGDTRSDFQEITVA